MIVGDFNAKIGRENIYRPTIGPDSLHEISNNNGTRLIHFATSQELTISSIIFHENIFTNTLGSLQMVEFTIR